MIDWAQIQQLEEDIGIEDFGEVVTLFMAEVDEAVSELDNTRPNSPDEMAPALHFLKGSAYNLGFKTFGDYCSEGESLAQNGRASEVDLEKVISLYTESKTAFFSQASNHCSFVPD